jgi:hypothetical protein
VFISNKLLSRQKLEDSCDQIICAKRYIGIKNSFHVGNRLKLEGIWFGQQPVEIET